MSDIFLNPGDYNIDIKFLMKLSEKILKCESASSKLRVEITFTDDAFIKKLNKKYLRRDYPTDCLCFNIQDETSGREIADIYISYNRAVEQARERNETLDFELAILTAHGVLHAIGYEDDRLIEKKQEDYVKRLFTRT